MAEGIIIKSASHEVSDEVRDANVKAVIEAAGYEVPEAEPEKEPTREDFKTQEEFEAAHVDWQDKEEEKAAKAEEEAGVPPPKKSRKTRAIERATAELQRKIKDLEAKLESKGEPGAAKVEEPPKEKPRPKRADFDQGEDGQQKYEDALLSWGAAKAVKDKALQDAQAANEARFNQNIQNYAAQVEEAKDKYDDWDEVVNQDIFIGQEVQLAILEQENGAEVIYYLGRHPAYAKKLGEIYNERGPLSAIREAERLSIKLLADKPSASDETDDEETTTQRRPKVPAPVRTVHTGGPSGGTTFKEIAAKPDYPGKARDLKAALAQQGR